MKSFLSASLILLITILSSSAFSAEVAGKIIMAKGDVQAINESGVIRSLKRRDSIFSHEIIKTGSASRVQIRFIDNALLALKENSELNIKAYVYNEANENENQVLIELLTGGFRTLTGKIGKGNKEAYKVNTPVASIGIRGTLYDVQISMDKIYAGVWKGGIALKTEQGDFNLGMNANFDFAEISSGGDFTGLLTPPASLTPTSSSRQETEAKGEKGEKGSPSQNNAKNKETQATAPLNNDSLSVPSPLERRKPPKQEDVQKDEDFVASDDSNTDNDTTPDTPVVTPLPAEGYTPDIRLTPAEFTQLSDGPKVAFILGLTQQNIGVGLNTNGDGERFFLSPTVAADGTSNYDIVRRGNALEKDFSTIVPWSDQVNWGIWQGTAETPIQRFTRFNNDQFSEPLTKDLFYMEFNPATALEIQNGLIDGNFVYSTSSTSLAGTNKTDYIANASNNGSITDINAQFNLTASSQNYTLSNINLNIDVDLNNDDTADQAWNVSAQNGQIEGSKITVDTLQGYLTNFQSEQQSEAKGTLAGFLLSPKSGTTVIDTFAGGFELSTVDGVEHVGGVLILQAGQRSQAQ